MTGFERLTSDVRREMLEDAKDVSRGNAFRAARRKSEECGLEEYIKFLSESMEYAGSRPMKRLTGDFRL